MVLFRLSILLLVLVAIQIMKTMLSQLSHFMELQLNSWCTRMEEKLVTLNVGQDNDWLFKYLYISRHVMECTI